MKQQIPNVINNSHIHYRLFELSIPRSPGQNDGAGTAGSPGESDQGRLLTAFQVAGVIRDPWSIYRSPPSMIRQSSPIDLELFDSSRGTCIAVWLTTHFSQRLPVRLD